MTVKYIKKQVLQDTRWLKRIYAIWGIYRNNNGERVNPKLIPYMDRPYIVSFCEKCGLQRIHRLCDSEREWFVFECDYCNNENE